MAQDIFELIGKVTIDGVDKVNKDLDSMSSNAKKSDSIFSKAFGFVGKVGAGLAVFDLASAGIQKISGAITGFMNDALEAQNVMAQTNAVLASTQGAAGMSAEEIANLANSLSKVTPIDDEAIQSAENMLLTFTNIGKDVFPQATKSVLDLSIAMKTDQKSAAIQLGKALNDPIQGITALTRVGVAFTDQQKSQIQTLVESGKTLDAQKIILAEIQKEFGGTSEAAGKTLAGSIARLKTQFGNLREEIGNALIPVLTFLANSAIPLVITVTEKIPVIFGKIADILGGPLHTGFVVVRDAILTFIAALQGDWTNSDKILGLHQIIGQLGKFIHDVVIPAFTTLYNILQGPVSTAFQYVKDHISDLLVTFAPMLVVLKRFVDALGDKGLVGALKELPSIILDVIKQGLAFKKEILDSFINLFENIDWSSVGSAILTGLGIAFATLKDVGKNLLDLGSTFITMVENVDWSSVGNAILSGLGTAFDTLKDVGNTLIDLGGMFIGLVESVDWTSVANSVLSYLQSGISTAISTAITGANWIYDWISNQISTVDWTTLASNIQGGLSSTIAGISSVAGGISFLQPAIDFLQNTVMPILTTLGGLIQSYLQPIIDTWSASFKEIASTIGTNLSPLLPQLQTLLNSLWPVIKVVGEAFGIIAAIIGAVLLIALQKLAIFLGATLPGMIQVTISIIGVMIAIIQTIVDVVTGVVKIVAALLTGDFSGAWNAAKDLVSNVTRDIGNLVSGMKDTVIGILNTLKDGIMAVFGGAISWLYNAGMDILNGLLNGINLVLSTVGTVISGIKTTITSAFTGAISWLYGVGQDIVTGIWNGISSLGGWLYNQVSGFITNNIWNPIKKLIPGMSPSPAYIPVGKSVVEGIAKGITDNKELLINAAESTATTLIDSLIKAIQNKVNPELITQALSDKLLFPALLKAQDELNKKLYFATLSGESAEDIAKIQSDLDAANKLLEQFMSQNQVTIDSYVKEATDALALENQKQKIIDGWNTTLYNLDSIISGEAIPALQSKLDALNQKLYFAMALKMPEEIAIGIRQQIKTVTDEIAQAGLVVEAAVDANIIGPVKQLSEDALKQIQSLMGKLKDSGESLIPTIVAALEAGKIKLEDAVKLIPNTMIPAIQSILDKLNYDLAEALVNGTDPSGIEKNIEIINALLESLGKTAVDTGNKISDGMTQASSAMDNANSIDIPAMPSVGSQLTPEQYMQGFLNPGTVSGSQMQEYYNANKRQTGNTIPEIGDFYITIGNKVIDDFIVKVVQRERPVR